MSKPQVYEGYLKTATYKACAHLLRNVVTPQSWATLQRRDPRDWRRILRERGYGSGYYEPYIQEAIIELDAKIGAVTCPDCERTLTDGRYAGEWLCSCGVALDLPYVKHNNERAV